jgi:hypothetical protein
MAENSLTIAALYDLLMAEVEPDLVSDRIPVLGFIYAGESEEQWKTRAQRYEKAFALVDTRMGMLLKKWGSEVLKFRKKAMGKLKQETAVKEEQTMKNLEDSFDAQ